MTNEITRTATASSFGEYPGNNTGNRAIPHSLGKKAKMVRLHMGGAGAANWDILGNYNHIKGSDAAANYDYEVTAIDDVNFYVGSASSYAGSANGTGNTYYWAAYG